MNTNNVSYLGKKVYLGIDVHKKTYAVTAICEGVVIKRFTHTADPHAFAATVERMFAGAELFSAYEAGFSGFGLHRCLEKVGVQSIVINPASLEVAQNNRVKTDKKDSKKLAEHLSLGRLTGIHIPSEEEEMHRCLTRTREQLVRNRVRIGNQIKMKLQYHSLLGPDDERSMSLKFLNQILAQELPDMLRFALDLLVQSWREATAHIKEIDKKIREACASRSKVVEVYRSVPGVGETSAAVLANELGDLGERFSNTRSVYSFTGLTPCEYSSGEATRKGRISRQGSPRLRHILTEIAWRAIRIDKALSTKFERIAVKRGKRKAIVAIARNLTGRIRACFLSGESYQEGRA